MPTSFPMLRRLAEAARLLDNQGNFAAADAVGEAIDFLSHGSLRTAQVEPDMAAGSFWGGNSYNTENYLGGLWNQWTGQQKQSYDILWNTIQGALQDIQQNFAGDATTKQKLVVLFGQMGQAIRQDQNSQTANTFYGQQQKQQQSQNQNQQVQQDLAQKGPGAIPSVQVPSQQSPNTAPASKTLGSVRAVRTASASDLSGVGQIVSNIGNMAAQYLGNLNPNLLNTLNGYLQQASQVIQAMQQNAGQYQQTGQAPPPATPAEAANASPGGQPVANGGPHKNDSVATEKSLAPVQRQELVSRYLAVGQKNGEQAMRYWLTQHQSSEFTQEVLKAWQEYQRQNPSSGTPTAPAASAPSAPTGGGNVSAKPKLAV